MCCSHLQKYAVLKRVPNTQLRWSKVYYNIKNKNYDILKRSHMKTYRGNTKKKSRLHSLLYKSKVNFWIGCHFLLNLYSCGHDLWPFIPKYNNIFLWKKSNEINNVYCDWPMGPNLWSPLGIWSRRKRKAHLYIMLTQERFFKEINLQAISQLTPTRYFEREHEDRDILKLSIVVGEGRSGSVG